MIYEEIDKKIATAMKQGERELLEVLKLIKTELVKADKDGMEMTEINQTKILLKMASQREDAIRQYIDGGRQDLADKERYEKEVIEQYIPKQPTEQDIVECTAKVVTAYKIAKGDGYSLSMRDMKPILSIVQETYPSASGKIVSDTLKKIIG